MERPIGVWISAALVIFVMGGWIGTILGASTADQWYRHYPFERGTLSLAESIHLEKAVSELETLQMVRFLARTATRDKSVDGKYLHEIAGIEHLRQHLEQPELRPILDFNSGLAHVDAAIANENAGKPELAASQMKSAEAIFQSLGWQDCSEETLKAAAARDDRKWFERAGTKEGE